MSSEIFRAMGPKVIIKQEALCIKGLRGKALTMAVTRKLTSAPSWVREFYARKYNWSKSSADEEKQEFITNLLSTRDIEGNDYLKTLHNTVHNDVDGKKCKRGQLQNSSSLERR